MYIHSAFKFTALTKTWKVTMVCFNRTLKYTGSARRHTGALIDAAILPQPIAFLAHSEKYLRCGAVRRKDLVQHILRYFFQYALMIQTHTALTLVRF